MCNLYSLSKNRDMLARFFRVSHNRAALALAREYPAEQMRIVQEGLDKEDLLQAA